MNIITAKLKRMPKIVYYCNDVTVIEDGIVSIAKFFVVKHFFVDLRNDTFCGMCKESIHGVLFNYVCQN